MKQKPRWKDAALYQLKPSGDHLVTISIKSHVVQLSNVHLPENYLGHINQAQEHLAQDIRQQSPTLEAYFRHNQAFKTNEKNLEFLYFWEMPEHYIWTGKILWDEPQILWLNPSASICEYLCAV